jgi:glutamine cyclotransferase
MKINAHHGFIILLLTVAFSACNDGSDKPATPDNPANPPAPLINYTVMNTYPHDTAYFIEGFEFYDGKLYESTGSPENFPYPSWLGKLDLKTGKLQETVTLDKMYFGEGITIFKDKVYQLTYTTKKGFVYDARTLKKLREFTYNTEGWGMTHDSTSLIMGDGSSNLYYMDPETLQVQKVVGVVDHNGPVSNINELEYIDGYIYANLWQTPYIIKIDPASGKVVGRLNLDTLVNEVSNKSPGHDYLNGIAYNPATKTVFVTGKRWPTIYEIKF